MRSQLIDFEALTRIAADQGIDTMAELAAKARVRVWVVYDAARRGRMTPSNVKRIAAALGIEPERFVRQAVEA